jgi:hypothetical protein
VGNRRANEKLSIPVQIRSSVVVKACMASVAHGEIIAIADGRATKAGVAKAKFGFQMSSSPHRHVHGSYK